ncbi:MAG: hypothetical protein RR547_00660 [Raoultibacter sp.]
MMEFWLIVITVILLYIAWKIPKDTRRESKEEAVASKKESMIASQLSQLKGETCELTMKNLTTFDSGTTSQATIVDYDSEWVRVSVSTRKGSVQKVIRISQISELRVVG